MKSIILVFITIFSSVEPLSDYKIQNSEEDAVRQTIVTLFEGMKESNADKVKSAFADGAIMKTIGRDTDGNAVVRDGSVDSFVESISSFEAGTLNEKILSYEIRIDGPLASAWTPYEFYRGEEFSHCGVNSFQLVNDGENWKIVYIIDTRRRDNCQ